MLVKDITQGLSSSTIFKYKKSKWGTQSHGAGIPLKGLKGQKGIEIFHWRGHISERCSNCKLQPQEYLIWVRGKFPQYFFYHILRHYWISPHSRDQRIQDCWVDGHIGRVFSHLTGCQHVSPSYSRGFFILELVGAIKRRGRLIKEDLKLPWEHLFHSHTPKACNFNPRVKNLTSPPLYWVNFVCCNITLLADVPQLIFK